MDANTVGAVAAVTGVSVRTLHHYDHIGLVVPSVRTPARYRGSTDADIERLPLLVVGTRALLRYLYLAGLTPTRLAGAVPSAACWPASSLPRPIEPGEAARLMRSVTAGRRPDAATSRCCCG